MKVKVIKEMPFARVGERLEIFNDAGGKRIRMFRATGFITDYYQKDIEVLIKDGWLEEVKEDSSIEQIDGIRKALEDC